MKKPLSIVLAAAMLFSSFAASAAQTDVITSQANQTVYNVADVASTPDQPDVSSPDVPEPGDMVTYYFLAPDNYFKTDAGAVNENVGYYYWDDGGNGAWPGMAATPAPEVHPNAFKITIPDSDSVATIIFNALVDAGSPADPVLAAAAHQTKDIPLDLEDCNGKIYVLALDEDHMSENPLSGALTSSGDWFALDAFKDSYNYSTYSKTEEEKQYKAGDTVAVDFMVGGVDNLGAVTAKIFYNTDYLEVVSGLTKDEKSNEVPVVLVNENESTKGTINIGALYDPEKGTDKFAGEKAKLCTVKFKALKDFNTKDLGISDIIVKLAKIDDKKINIIVNKTENENVYTELVTTVNPKEDPKPATEKVKIGDVNKDGKIDSGDSLSILRASVGLEKVEIKLADIDGNERIDSGDSLAVLRASVKLFDASNEKVGTEIELPVA